MSAIEAKLIQYGAQEIADEIFAMLVKLERDESIFIYNEDALDFIKELMEGKEEYNENY